MLKRVLVFATMTVALTATVPSANSALAAETAREPAFEPALYQRPTQVVSYTIWYKGPRMNYWAVYTTTPNIGWADHIVTMLQNIGYASFWSPNYN